MKNIVLSILLATSVAYTAEPFTGKINDLKININDPAYNIPIDVKSKFTSEALLKNGKKVYFASVNR